MTNIVIVFIDIHIMMSNKIEAHYECCHCSKNYKIKKAYDRHLLVCSVISKTVKERKTENEEYENIPTVKQMYEMIQILIVKNENLEKQVNKMSKWINNKKKVNVLEWLNENNVPNNDFNNWVETIEITEKHMEFVFEHNFIDGVNLTVRELLNKDLETIPIKAFEQKEGILYVYNGSENKWENINQSQFDTLFIKITKGLLGQLKLWKDKNIHRLYQTEFTEKYIGNVKKITGGDLSREQQIHKLKQAFYNTLKINIKNIVQYEFVF